MPGGGERHWVDPRFRTRTRPAATRPATAGATPTSRVGAARGGTCPPRGATGQPRGRRLTYQESVLEERIERLRRAVQDGQEAARREAEARAARGRGRGVTRGRIRVGSSAGAGPSRASTSSALGEVNAQLAAQAATAGKTTTTRIAQAPTGAPRPRKPLTMQEKLEQERMTRRRVATEAGAREAAANEERERARALAARAGRRVTFGPNQVLGTAGVPLLRPAPQPCAAPTRSCLAPPRSAPVVQQQTVVIQPGEIDPTETTVITVPTTSSRTDYSYVLPTPRVISPLSSPEVDRSGGGTCERVPQTTICPTNVRTLIARPIAANPNVSVLDDGFDESELLTEQDFAAVADDDFLLGPSTVCPRATAAQPSLSPEPAPRLTVEDVYSQIERNKAAWADEQYKRNKEFLERSRVMRQDDPARIAGRIMSTYYSSFDPELAATYQECFGETDVPVGDLLDVGPSCPQSEPETGAFTRELLDAFVEPQYGAFGEELMGSNLQMTQPQSQVCGPYSQDLFENVEMFPTTGYAPGRLGTELQSHVQWVPPLPPDPNEGNLIGSFARPRAPPPPPSGTDTCGLDDLIDWF